VEPQATLKRALLYALRLNCYNLLLACFTDAELTLEGNTLIVESVDTFDIDDDGNRSESVFIQAQRVAIMENDLGTPCS